MSEPQVAHILLRKKFKKTFQFTGHPNHGVYKFQTAQQIREEEYYWQKQKEYWIEGKDGLTGLQYFYLTTGKLKTVEGFGIRPDWRDGDQYVFEEYDYCLKKKRTLAVIKRREFGLTSIFAGCVPIYNALINAGSISLLTSADKTRVETMFSEKTMFFLNNIDIPKHLLPKQMSVRQAGALVLDDGSGEFGSGSKIKCLETANDDKNAKRFENERAKFIFLDEWFLHLRADTVFNSSQACLKQSFTSKGSMVLGGSCGGSNDADTEKMKHSSALVERMIQDAETNLIHPIFIQGTLCINEADELDDKGAPTGKILSFMKDGISNEKKALEWVEKTRARLYRGKDKKPYYNFVRSYPLTLQEVFDINKQGILSEEIYASLSEAKKKSIEEDAERTINLRKDSHTKRIEVVSASKSIYTIVEEPKLGHTYISGTDPIPLGANISDEGSEYAQVIYDVDADKAVAYYSKRDLDADRLIGDNILLQEWYKSEEFPQGAPTMVEYNRGEVAMRIYQELDKGDLLADRPKNLGIVYEESIKGKKGWYSNDKTIARANSYMIKNLTDFADRQRLIRLIAEASVFPTGNLDVLDAYKSMLIYLTDIRNGEMKVAKSGLLQKQIPYVGIDKNGRRVRLWHTITYDPNEQRR